MVIVSVTTSTYIYIYIYIYISALFDLFITDFWAEFECFSLELTGGGGLESHDLTRVILKSQILGLEASFTNIHKRLDLTLT